ncbi:hypothetical protein C0J52_19151 [Blattella germanica]|nr:hypothetical protein C0J52_19151 [Blattella germanica]
MVSGCDCGFKKNENCKMEGKGKDRDAWRLIVKEAKGPPRAVMLRKKKKMTVFYR